MWLRIMQPGCFLCVGFSLSDANTDSRHVVGSNEFPLKSGNLMSTERLALIQSVNEYLLAALAGDLAKQGDKSISKFHSPK